LRPSACCRTGGAVFLAVRWPQACPSSATSSQSRTGSAHQGSLLSSFFLRQQRSRLAGAQGGGNEPPWSPHEAAKSAARLPSAPSRLWSLAAPETLLVEDLALSEQVIDCSSQFGRQDGQRLALAPLLLLPLLPRPGPRAGPQKQTRRLREGPAQMRVAD